MKFGAEPNVTPLGTVSPIRGKFGGLKFLL